MPQHPNMPAGNYMPANVPMDAQQAMAYQNYMQRTPGYGQGMPGQPGMPPGQHHQS